MKCRDCTCYVDGHGKNGAKTAKGTGLCTLYDREVLADSECQDRVSKPTNANKSTTVKAKKVYQQEPIASGKPKKKHRVLKVFLWMFFLPIMATIAIVKSEKLKKKTKGILLAAMWILFAVVGATGETTESAPTTSDSTNSSVVASDEKDASSQKDQKEKSVKVKKIYEFSTEEYAVFVGDTTELSIKLSPNGIGPESVVVASSNTDILKIGEITAVDDGSKTMLTFVCTATGEGVATVTVHSAANEEIVSNTVTFTAEIAPRITSIGRFSTSMAISEVGDVRTITMPMKPAGLTLDDVEVVCSEENIVSITDMSIADEGDQSVLTFNITGIGVGKTNLVVKSTDGKTTSNELSYRVDEKDTSRTVYVTPTGERYHYSAACAGKNATATTLNKASRLYTGCKKCT